MHGKEVKMKRYFAVLNTGSANTLIRLPYLSALDGSLLVRIYWYMYVPCGCLQQLGSDTLICPAAAPRSQSALLLLPRHTSPSSHNPTTVASRDSLMYTWRTVRVISGLNSQPLTVISPLELQQTHMDFATPGTSSGGPPGPAPGTRSGCWYHEHVGPCDTQSHTSCCTVVT